MEENIRAENITNSRIYQVGGETNPRKLAGAIVAGLQTGNVTLAAIGPFSAHNMVLALSTINEWGYAPTLEFSTSGSDIGTKVFCTVRAYDYHTREIE